jgi:hypothetical protein
MPNPYDNDEYIIMTKPSLIVGLLLGWRKVWIRGCDEGSPRGCFDVRDESAVVSMAEKRKA